MDLHTIVFMSTAIRPFSELELSNLSLIASSNNERAGITGLLIYCDGNFIEVLEGEKDKLDTMFGKIARDPRHTEIEVLLSTRIKERNFISSSMGVLNMARMEHLDRERIRKIGDQAKQDPRDAGNAAYRMLLDFYLDNTTWISDSYVA